MDIQREPQDTAQLRQQLLDEIYAGASAGLGAMLLDEETVLRADSEELEELARRYGLR